MVIIVFVPLCLSPLSVPPSIQSKDSKTPLHMAATHGRFSCSQALIQNGESSYRMCCFTSEFKSACMSWQ